MWGTQSQQEKDLETAYGLQYNVLQHNVDSEGSNGDQGEVAVGFRFLLKSNPSTTKSHGAALKAGIKKKVESWA